MGKPKVAGQDVFERINFLFQSAYAVVTSSPKNINLARFYCATLLQIARHQVLRIDPHMKRRICKKCQVLLIPGFTATVRHRSKREKHAVVTCCECGSNKRFLSRKDFVLWSDQPQFSLDQPKIPKENHERIEQLNVQEF